MLQTICNYISNQLVFAHIIEEEKKPIYDYGIYLFLMTMVTVSTIIILGILWRKVDLTLAFIFVMASIRHYTGGYHASHYWQCHLLSCTSYCVVIYLASNGIMIGTIFLPMIGGMAMVYNLMVGSLNSDRNPKTPEEMIVRMKRARIIFILYDMICLLGIFFNLGEITIWLIIVWCQIIVMISLLITKTQRRYFKWKLKKRC